MGTVNLFEKSVVLHTSISRPFPITAEREVTVFHLLRTRHTSFAPSMLPSSDKRTIYLSFQRPHRGGFFFLSSEDIKTQQRSDHCVASLETIDLKCRIPVVRTTLRNSIKLLLETQKYLIKDILPPHYAAILTQQEHNRSQYYQVLKLDQCLF